MKKIGKKIQRVSKVSKIVAEVEDEFNDAEQAAENACSESKNIDPSKLIPTPCVPFNLECSGHYQGAFLMGKIVNLIGDSHAGKTLFALSVLAECSIDKRFDNYKLVYKDIEAANEFDMEYLFGKKCAKRVQTDDDEAADTFEEFSDGIERLFKKGEPFIYVLDSADALNTESAIKLYEENMSAREKGTKEKGSYGDGKAALFSAFFKRIKRKLSDLDSVLIIISQTRDNLGFGAQFNPKVRSGGKALKFYSFHEIWLAMEKKEKKGDRTYITNVEAKITKNKLIGRHGVARFPILFDYGVDNITSCINFMIKEGFWKGTKKAINTDGFYPTGPISYANLVQWIENGGYEEELAIECEKAYHAIIQDMKPTHRKRKYC